MNRPNVEMEELANDLIAIEEFGDLVEITQPHYLSFEQLDRQHAIYLTDVYYSAFNAINYPSVQMLPQDVLNSIKVIEFQRYDKMVKHSGEVFDWSASGEENRYGIFEPRDIELLDEKLLMEAANNIYLEDSLDLEKTVLYNLIEVKPKYPQLSVDYLRCLFWCYRDSKVKWEHIDLGSEFIHRVWDYYRQDLLDEYGTERYLFDVETLKDATIIIHDFNVQDKIVSDFNKYLDRNLMARGKDTILKRFGNPLYQSLEKLRSQMLKRVSQKHMSEYSDFLRPIIEVEELYEQKVKSGAASITWASLLPAVSSCEIILKVKLCLLDLPWWNSDNTFYENIRFVFENKRDVLSGWIPQGELSEFHSVLERARKMKNKGSHTTEYITIKEANDLLEFVSNNVIRGIMEYIR